MRRESRENRIKKFQVLVDTREQMPYQFKNSIIKGLSTGDYTIKYEDRIYEDKILVERKRSVSELYAAVGTDRERFERELEKLAIIPFKFVVCEFDYMDLVNDQPPGQLEAPAVYGSIISWHIKYQVPFLFLKNRTNARNFIYKLFENFVKYKILHLE